MCLKINHKMDTVYVHYILLSNPAYSHTFENRSSDPPNPLPAGFAAADPVPNPVVASAGVAAGSALPHPPKSSSAAIVVSAGRVPPLAAGAEIGAPHPSSTRPLLVAAAGDLAGSIEGGAAATGSALVHTSGEPHGSEAPSGEKLDVAGFAGLEAVEERLNGEAMVGEVVD
jgi:hypothetical protein